MEAIDRIREIWKRIPAMMCKHGCHDCCGVIMMSKAEWENTKPHRKATSLDCPYLKNGGCEIYEDRPTVCRLFGTCEEDMLLKCPHGRRPVVTLSKAQARAILNEVKAVGG